jgi:hypothetical protein
MKYMHNDISAVALRGRYGVDTECTTSVIYLQGKVWVTCHTSAGLTFFQNNQLHFSTSISR